MKKHTEVYTAPFSLGREAEEQARRAYEYLESIGYPLEFVVKRYWERSDNKDLKVEATSTNLTNAEVKEIINILESFDVLENSVLNEKTRHIIRMLTEEKYKVRTL